MATTTDTTTEVGHEAGHIAFPPFTTSTFPSQILWFAIIFGAMYYYLSKRFLPAVGGVIEARRALIAKDIDEATAMQTQATAAAAEHEKALAKARAARSDRPSGARQDRRRVRGQAQGAGRSACRQDRRCGVAHRRNPQGGDGECLLDRQRCDCSHRREVDRPGARRRTPLGSAVRRRRPSA